MSVLSGPACLCVLSDLRGFFLSVLACLCVLLDPARCLSVLFDLFVFCACVFVVFVRAV